MIRRILLAMLIFLASVCLAASSADFQTLRPKAAQKEYEAKVSGLLVHLERDLNEARQKYVEALRAALAETTRAGNLDEAVRIKQTIEQHESRVVSERPTQPQFTEVQRGLAAQLIGTKWEGAASTRQFAYDAVIVTERNERKMWPWAALDERTIAIRQEGSVEIVLFNDDLSQGWRSAYQVGQSKMVWQRVK